MAERTREELADFLELLNLGATGETWKAIDEAVAILRESEGERIEAVLYNTFTEFQDWDGYLSPGPIRPLFDKWFPTYTGDENPKAVFLAKHVTALILRDPEEPNSG